MLWDLWEIHRVVTRLLIIVLLKDWEKFIYYCIILFFLNIHYFKEHNNQEIKYYKNYKTYQTNAYK